MMQARSKRLRAALVAASLAAFGLLGCAKQASHDVGGSGSSAADAERVENESGFGNEAGATSTPERPAVGEAEWAAAIERNLQDVFFGFDKHDLNAESRAVLSQNAQYLRAQQDVKLWIEGHCDERGTNEYNLALGERRARAVVNYLTQAGIPAYRMKVISYGEERPFVRGHDESAWSMNRRAHFKARR